MRTSILENLCCPSCRGELLVNPFSEEENGYRHRDLAGPSEGPRNQGAETIIKEGVLLCPHCTVWYPIYSYVPVLLVFQTDFHKNFAKKHSAQLETLSQYKPPTGLPKPGEKSVQETFTDEWNCVQGDELSFLYSSEDLKALNKKVWLKWLGDPQNKINNVLNIGCGLGRESQALQDVTNAEVFAVDLNFAVLGSGEIFKSNPRIHLLVASLFNLPLKLSSFDLVYSQGVTMATFSTWEAIKSIASYVRKNGFMFIWVYGLDDHLLRKGTIGFLTRTNYLIEKALRPLISRSPKVLRDIFFTTTAFVLHPLIKSRVRHKSTWRIKNTDHDLRDWLSPKYAHRHSYNEVFEWFENLGFAIIDVQSPAAFKRLFQKQLWGVGLTGRKL